MRRTVLIVPGLLSGTGSDSFLRQKLPALSALAELGDIRRVTPVPESVTPEAMFLGLGPNSVGLQQGPLTVSALGFDPPERSTHFHLSLMSYADGIASTPSALPTSDEVDLLLKESKRLDTKLLTVLKGEVFDHALVWESLGDLETTHPSGLLGQNIGKLLPNGDGDVGLRRLIDDSINLLSSLDLNERRFDQGLPPFNLLWPWGQGIRTPVPNLALRRGEPAAVESGSMRVAGLTRLAGYRHIDRHLFGRGLQTKFRKVAERALNRDLTIVVVDAPMELRAKDKPEELEWFVREMDRELLQPLLDDCLNERDRVCLIAPGPVVPSESQGMAASAVGLSLSLEHGVIGNNVYPFDERSLDERKIPVQDLWALVDAAITNSDQP